jgi:ABC-type transport system substrate-binding protein
MKLKISICLISLAFITSFSGCTSGKKSEKNTLNLYSTAAIKGLDPAHASDQYSGLEIMRAYEGLLQYHYLKRPYELIPNLAAEMPSISKDGKVITFKLKQGVVFHDDPCFKATNGKGRELVAEDFIYSWKRLADTKVASDGWWIFDGKIVGLNEWRDAGQKAGNADYNAPVEGLKALDKHTLQITLKAPSYQFLYYLAMPFAPVVAREAVETYGNQFINHAVGTGPFKLESFSPNSKLVWVKNPTYRKEFYPSEGEAGDKEKGLLEDAGKPLPLADKVIVHVFIESQPQWLTFMKGGLDYTAIPKDNYATAVTPDKKPVAELANKGVSLIMDTSLDITHFSFNMADPVVGKSKYLRQAMSLVLDNKLSNDLFYNNRVVSAQTPIPPGLDGYDPNFKNPYLGPDVVKAKQLMVKAGFPDGKGLPPLKYLTLSDSTSRQWNEYYQKQFAQIGIKLEVQSSSWPDFNAAVKNKKGQVYSFAWGADYPDAENFLQLFYSKNMSPGPNDSNYSNPEFDKLYEASLKLPPSKERTELYKKMALIVVEDVPWIPGVHRMIFNLINPWFKNYKYTEVDHGRSKYYRIDDSQKK